MSDGIGSARQVSLEVTTPIIYTGMTGCLNGEDGVLTAVYNAQAELAILAHLGDSGIRVIPIEE
jgi:hypothetical protein